MLTIQSNYQYFHIFYQQFQLSVFCLNFILLCQHHFCIDVNSQVERCVKIKLQECGWRDQVKKHCKGGLTDHGIYLIVAIQVHKCSKFCTFILLVPYSAKFWQGKNFDRSFILNFWQIQGHYLQSSKKIIQYWSFIPQPVP